MTATADRLAAALVDIADLVAETGVVDLEIRPYVAGDGEVRIALSVGHHRIGERADFDAVCKHIGIAEFEAGHSRGEFWYVYTAGAPVFLPCGARVTVSTVLRGRPLDLCPLPVRRRRAS